VFQQLPSRVDVNGKRGGEDQCSAQASTSTKGSRHVMLSQPQLLHTTRRHLILHCTVASHSYTSWPSYCDGRSRSQQPSSRSRDPHNPRPSVPSTMRHASSQPSSQPRRPRRYPSQPLSFARPSDGAISSRLRPWSTP
jgi:hypothetical protein